MFRAGRDSAACCDQPVCFLPRLVPIKIEIQVFGHGCDRDLTAHAVAVRVEWRSERRDAEPARSDRHDAAADPALAGQTDLEGPVAGSIVESFHHHLGENSRHILPLHDRNAR